MRGLVLEGGGAKGAYQIGAWEAFRHLGLEFGAVTGTSVGALNGALFAQGDFEQAHEMWYNLKPEHVISGDPKAIEKLATLEMEAGDLEPITRYVASVFTGGGLDITPLKQLIGRMISEERLRASNVPLGIVTVSVTDFKPMELFVENVPQGQLQDYLLASANLPVFKLSRVDGKLYVDGGFYDNLPVNLITQKGIREIVAVELQSVGVRQPIRADNLNITWITPSENIGRILEFNPEKIRRNIRLGYFDTLRAFNGYGGSQYYLDGRPTEGWGFGQLSSAPEAGVRAVREWMGMQEADNRRFVFEYLVPALCTLLDAPPAAGYDELVLRLYERVAGLQGIDRLQVFSPEAFREAVQRQAAVQAVAPPGSLMEPLTKHLRQSQIYLKTKRDEVLPWIFQELFVPR